MKKMRNDFKIIKNDGGMLTVDFLFGIIITFVVMLFLLRVSFSLMIAEVAQYVAFSTARAHSVADVDLETQRNSAKQKFAELVQNKTWNHFFKNAFEFGVKGTSLDDNFLKSGDSSVGGTSGGGSFNDQYLNNPSLDGSGPSGSPFVGVVIPLKLEWLKVNLLIFGDSVSGDTTLKTNVTGFLNREPSQKECLDFMEQRYDHILQIGSPRFSNPGIQRGKNSYVPMEDNGC